MAPLREQLDEVLRGERAHVVIPKACRVIERRPRGRPRVHVVGAHPGDGYAFRTDAGWPMRCRRRGCTKILRMRATTIVCSPACDSLLRRELEEYLAIMRGEMTARDLAPYFRAVR